jgi:hypothetical protein
MHRQQTLAAKKISMICMEPIKKRSAGGHQNIAQRIQTEKNEKKNSRAEEKTTTS